MLTEVTGDVVRDVNLPICRLAPLAASGGAGVGISLRLAVDGDVSSNQDGTIVRAD